MLLIGCVSTTNSNAWNCQRERSIIFLGYLSTNIGGFVLGYFGKMLIISDMGYYLGPSISSYLPLRKLLHMLIYSTQIQWRFWTKLSCLLIDCCLIIAVCAEKPSGHDCIQLDFGWGVSVDVYDHLMRITQVVFPMFCCVYT